MTDFENFRKIKCLKIIFITNIITLAGCYYKDNCLVFPQSVYCMDKQISDFDRYSKERVSLEQKTDDIKQCGGVPDKHGYIFEPLRQANQGGDKGWLAVRNFDNCMKNKGYNYTD